MSGPAVRSGGGPAPSTLASLVGDVVRFEAEHWGRRALHRPTSWDFAALLSLDDVDRIVASGVRRPAFRLVRDGTTLPDAACTSSVRLGGRQLADVADADRIAAEVAAGASLVLQGLHRTWPPLDRWCRDLEAELAHTVQANAYLSPPRSSGLGEHADDHDVLVLQVRGSKDWTVDGLGDVTLRPGHVMYVPAGLRHAASAAQATSLHLTVGVLRTTARDVVLRLLRTVDDPDLGRSLPVGLDRSGRRAELEAVLGQALEAAARAVAAVDPAAAAGGVADGRRDRVRRSGAARLRSVAALDELGDATIVALRSDRSIRRVDQPGGGRAVLELADRRISMPVAMARALDLLLTGRPLPVGSLPGLDEGDRKVLVRRLVAEGVLDVAGADRDDHRPGEPARRSGENVG